MPMRPSASTFEQPKGHDPALPHRTMAQVSSDPLHARSMARSAIPTLYGLDGSLFENDHGFRSVYLPKMKFLKFDGTNPKLWSDQCEMYFELYSMISALKMRFAALDFMGPAVVWLQSVERRERI